MKNVKKVFEFYPAVNGAGLQMEGYHIWCGSVLKEGDTYYLFAARWKKEKSFPLGYLTDSEIVMATTDDLSKPFQFVKTIIGKRDGGHWDSVMAHHGQAGVSKEFYQYIQLKRCIWPTPDWLWDNDQGGGFDTGPWQTVRTREWMEELGVTEHWIAKDGIQKIEF